MFRLFLTACISFLLGIGVALGLKAILEEPAASACQMSYIQGFVQPPRLGRPTRICYPVTWSLPLPTHVPISSGGEAVLPVSSVAAIRTWTWVPTPGLPPRTVALYANLQFWDPMTNQEMGGTACTLWREDSYQTCEVLRFTNTEPRSVVFITPDGYRVEGSYGYVDPFRLTPPTAEEIQAFDRFWPDIYTDMRRIVSDFVARQKDRRGIPITPAPTPATPVR